MKNKSKSHIPPVSPDATRVDTAETDVSTTPAPLVVPNNPHGNPTSLMCANSVPKFHLSCADALNFLRSLSPNSIDSVVTDPPAGIEFMGKGWDGNKGGSAKWIDWLTQILVEANRVMKPGAHMAIWTFPRTSHWTATAVEMAGFQYVQKLIHIFATGKSHGLIVKATNLPEFAGFSTTLKTSHEEWLLVRKPLEGTVYKNLQKWGVGAMNVEACNVVGDPGQPPRCAGTIMHDGSPHVLSLFPNAPGQMAKLRSDGAPMNNKVYSKMKHGSVAKPPRVDSSTSSARFFYCTKATRSDKNSGLDDGETNPHPTVKSARLMRAITRLVNPPRGTVLDMFAGSGSTGKAAMLEGFDFVGCDLSKEYINIAKKRISHALSCIKQNTA